MARSSHGTSPSSLPGPSAEKPAEHIKRAGNARFSPDPFTEDSSDTALDPNSARARGLPEPEWCLRMSGADILACLETPGAKPLAPPFKPFDVLLALCPSTTVTAEGRTC